MNNNSFDYLIPKISDLLIRRFLEILSEHEEFSSAVDTSPLLNMTLGIFTTCLIHSLDKIKQCSIGETKLIDNIELAKNNIIKAIKDLPFISKVEFVNT